MLEPRRQRIMVAATMTSIVPAGIVGILAGSALIGAAVAAAFVIAVGFYIARRAI
jgi:hypothetical protein